MMVWGADDQVESAMSAGAGHVTCTPAEYLALERAAETRSEYLLGRSDDE
jgi:hypothetical protein